MKLTIVLLLALLMNQSQNNIPSDFSELRKISVDELALKTDLHRSWGIDKIERWDLNQGDGQLIFSLRGGLKAVCPAQIIGTYNQNDRTWLWAWDNPSISEKLIDDALKLRKYGQEHKIDLLTQRKWEGSEDDAWAMAAIAVKLAGAQGAYRGPAGDTLVFISFGKVTLSKH
jgi:hypothetical protein